MNDAAAAVLILAVAHLVLAVVLDVARIESLRRIQRRWDADEVDPDSSAWLGEAARDSRALNRTLHLFRLSRLVYVVGFAMVGIAVWVQISWMILR